MVTPHLYTVRVFRYDPAKGGEGHYDTYTLDIPAPITTTILDVLLRIQREQDPSLAFRFACRVNMCGSCGMVINGSEGLACKVNVSDLSIAKDITLRPLNHFPVIKDLVVDMGPFFEKYEQTLPFFEPKEIRTEPYIIPAADPKRVDIGMSTDCIACGCCVSSCTMVNYQKDYAGPASLNRAFTLLADERDALFDSRLVLALNSCYSCRTEFNCTEVCPKNISSTRAIKYIQRLALKHHKSIDPHPVEQAKAVAPQAPDKAHKPCNCAAKHAQSPPPRRAFLQQMGFCVVGIGATLALGTVAGITSVAPTLRDTVKQWVPVGKADNISPDSVQSMSIDYIQKHAFYEQKVKNPVLIHRDKEGAFHCFSSSCPHLGCLVDWDVETRRFKCACHGGAFDINGNVVAGPPPRPLESLPFKVVNGILMVEVA